MDLLVTSASTTFLPTDVAAKTVLPLQKWFVLLFVCNIALLDQEEFERIGSVYIFFSVFSVKALKQAQKI